MQHLIIQDELVVSVSVKDDPPKAEVVNLIGGVKTEGIWGIKDIILPCRSFGLHLLGREKIIIGRGRKNLLHPHRYRPTDLSLGGEAVIIGGSKNCCC